MVEDGPTPNLCRFDYRYGLGLGYSLDIYQIVRLLIGQHWVCFEVLNIWRCFCARFIYYYKILLLITQYRVKLFLINLISFFTNKHKFYIENCIKQKSKMIRSTYSLRYLYVDSSKIAKIKKEVAGKSWWQWIKAELNIGKYIMSQGYKESKKDISFYIKNFSKQKSPQTAKKMYQIYSNLWKLPPIAILFCFPGGLPLILAYMAFLPALTPTWFLRDTKKQKLDKLRRKKQMEALRFFIDCGSIRVRQPEEQAKSKGQGGWKQVKTNINLGVFRNMSVEEKKRVKELCYGFSFDGTNIIQRSFKIKLNSLISPVFSEYLMQKDLLRRLQGQEVGSPENINQNFDKLSQKIVRQSQKLLNQQKKV